MILKVKFKKLHEDTILPKRINPGDACMDVYAHNISPMGFGLFSIGLGFATQIPPGWKGVMVPRSSMTNSHVILQNSPCQVDSGYRGEWIVKVRTIDHQQVNANISPTVVASGSIVSMDFNTYYNNIESIIYRDLDWRVGDRIAQIYFERVWDIDVIETDELEESERQEGGFGSTGNR